MSIGKRVLQQKHLDLAGVHAALLPSGKVLFFSYFAPEENNVNLAKWQLWQEDQGPLSAPHTPQKLSPALTVLPHWVQ